MIPPNKKTYQQDPANYREALREAELDEAEGADIMMVGAPLCQECLPDMQCGAPAGMTATAELQLQSS